MSFPLTNYPELIRRRQHRQNRQNLYYPAKHLLMLNWAAAVAMLGFLQATASLADLALVAERLAIFSLLLFLLGVILAGHVFLSLRQARRAAPSHAAKRGAAKALGRMVWLAAFSLMGGLVSAVFALIQMW